MFCDPGPSAHTHANTDSSGCDTCMMGCESQLVTHCLLACMRTSAAACRSPPGHRGLPRARGRRPCPAGAVRRQRRGRGRTCTTHSPCHRCWCSCRQHPPSVWCPPSPAPAGDDERETRECQTVPRGKSQVVCFACVTSPEYRIRLVSDHHFSKRVEASKLQLEQSNAGRSSYSLSLAFSTNIFFLR